MSFLYILSHCEFLVFFIILYIISTFWNISVSTKEVFFCKNFIRKQSLSHWKQTNGINQSQMFFFIFRIVVFSIGQNSEIRRCPDKRWILPHLVYPWPSPWCCALKIDPRFCWFNNTFKFCPDVRQLSLILRRYFTNIRFNTILFVFLNTNILHFFLKIMEKTLLVPDPKCQKLKHKLLWKTKN